MLKCSLLHGILTVFTWGLTIVIALDINFWDLHVSTLRLRSLAISNICRTTRVIEPSDAIAPVITQKFGPSLDEHPFFFLFIVLGQLFFDICDLFTSVLGQHNHAWRCRGDLVAGKAFRRLDSRRYGLKQCLLLDDYFVKWLKLFSKGARKLALAILIISICRSRIDGEVFLAY